MSTAAHSSSISQGDNAKVLNHRKSQKPLILLYHVYHDAPNWWFHLNDEDFSRCSQKCQISLNKSDFAIADMVVFEAPRFIKKRENGVLYLEYFRDWGEWPETFGNREQVRTMFTHEPQTAGLSGNDLSFGKHLFNYTITFHRDADFIYPYGHYENITTEVALPG